MKNLNKLALTSILALSSVLASCGGTTTSNSSSTVVEKAFEASNLLEAPVTASAYASKAVTKTKVKVGLITLHDENSTYDKNFIDAMKEVCDADDNIELIVKTGIGESSACYDAAAELADGGCDIVFADSFGHEKYIIQAAKEFTNVQFGHATGTQALQEKLSNYHNAFASIYEGRYLAGVAAGLKLQEMINSNTLPKTAKKDDNGNYILGYVGAYTYAEVISGYTSWYLGVKSVVENVSMNVQFTGSWYDETAEKEAANTLISKGAAVISQHADSMGAPSACETAGVPNISYNGSTASACPNTFVVSSRINWAPYFSMMIEAVRHGESYPTDWCGTIGTGSVELTAVGTAAAAGTQAKLDEVKAKLVAGTLNVFDTSKFTVNGEKLTSYLGDIDGDYTGDTQVINSTYFAESGFRSAPYFDVQIDGINLLNTVF